LGSDSVDDLRQRTAVEIHERRWLVEKQVVERQHACGRRAGLLVRQPDELLHRRVQCRSLSAE
jgi:hypothetical protein